MTTARESRPSHGARAVSWRRTDRAEIPYEADVDGHRWTVRVNDFPTQALYTLLVDGAPVEDLDAWPDAWQRPRGEAE